LDRSTARAGAGLLFLLAGVALGSCGGASVPSGGGGGGPTEPVVDQAHAPHPDLFVLNSGVPAEKAQTFTVGIPGRLVRIDVLSIRDANAGTGALHVDLRPTLGNAPVEDDQAVLASVTIPAEDVPGGVGGLLSIELPWPGVAVGVGARLAIAFRAEDGGRFVIRAGGNDGYPLGAHYARDATQGVDDWIVLPGADIGFATYVDQD
jgi:hypothetical protein